MKYRPDKNGIMISQLGYGRMRFTKKGPSVDFEESGPASQTAALQSGDPRCQSYQEEDLT